MSEAYRALWIVLIAVVAIAYLLVWTQRSRHLLETWAAAQGYDLLHAEHRVLRKGPFFWWPSRAQAVYRVTVSDGAGRVRHGWIRVGGWVLGVIADPGRGALGLISRRRGPPPGRETLRRK